MHGRDTTNDEERAILGSHRTNVQQPALIASRLDPTSVTVSPNRADPLRWVDPSGTLWAMGLTKVTTKLTSLVDPKRSFESLFLVDTGRYWSDGLNGPFGRTRKARHQTRRENGVRVGRWHRS